MPPRLNFGLAGTVAQCAREVARDDFLDVVGEGVAKELLLVGLVDDHRRAPVQSSSYLRLLPRARSIG